MNTIELYNVTLQTGESTLLEDISIQIKEGELFGIMGTSGSGKSTLLKVINGLAIDVEGEVLLKGENIYQFRPEKMLEYHTRAGFIFQNAALISNMSVMENLALGFQYHQGMNMQEVFEQVEPHLEYFGISGQLLSQRPGTLSSGEKMLISIVRALAKNPEFIFWDQPLAPLDFIHQRKLLRLIEKYKEEGRTMIMVTNHSEIAMDYSDHLGILEEGRLIASGTPQALRRSRNKTVKMLTRV